MNVDDSKGYHIFNGLIHSANTILVFFLAFSFVFSDQYSTSIDLTSYGLSILSALIFSIHPIHVSAVSEISARPELLSSFFFLLSLLHYLHLNPDGGSVAPMVSFVPCICLGCLAFLAKESAMTIFFAVFLLEVLSPVKSLYSKSFRNKRVVLFLAASISCLAFQKYWVGRLYPLAAFVDNPLPSSDLRTNVLTRSFILLYNLAITFFPFRYRADYTFNCFPMIQSFADRRNLLTLVVLLTIIYASRALKGRRLDKGLLIILTVFILPIVPESNIFYPAGKIQDRGNGKREKMPLG